MPIYIYIYKSSDVQYSLVKDDSGNRKRGFRNTNFLHESVDFEHFRVKDDWNHYPGMGSEVLAIHTSSMMFYIYTY